jgi:carbon-monoxide dehydrogenase large subunit
MPGSLLGTAVVRVEDPELLEGRGTFVANLRIDGLLHLRFVRSTVAHARITSIDASEAAALPGVVAVLTGDDLDLPAHHGLFVFNPALPRPPLARGTVYFVGDPLAIVVADTAAAAEDAAEAVVVDYEPLPAVVDMEAALDPATPQVYDALPGNLAAGQRSPDAPDLLADADVVVRARIENQRVAVLPMEGNSIAVVPGDDGAGHQLTIHVSTQMPHGMAKQVARVFSVPIEAIRVIAPHVGGGFGGKAGLQAEYSVAIGVARHLDRPVTWTETRSENLVAMPQGRGQVQYAEMGFRSDGTIVGLRVRSVGDAGAYAGFGGALLLGPSRMMAQGVYRIPKLGFEGAVAATTTTPMGAFRGAGRPEAAALLERIMDIAADELGIDPVELRLKNLLGSDVFPFVTLTGVTYDSGDYAAALREVVRAAGYDELLAEQAARRQRGDSKLLGIGVASYVEITAGGSGGEYGSVEVHDDGTATIRVGTSAHGQGHATAFAMIVADRLGIPMEDVRFVQSDTAVVPRGGGTGGSRSLQLGGTAIAQAAEAVLERAKDIAGRLLEADPADVVVTDDGRLGVAGVPARSFTWAEIATAAVADGGDPLAVGLDSSQDGATFPFGAHVAVVEVDSETGHVEVLRHVAVDDCGRILNPLLVTGQQHGGIAQGIAQALWEQVVYDEDGNPLTSNLADYAMPSAAELPSFEAGNTQTPTPLNPLGAKGIGESGTIGSTPSVQNAVVDAVSHLGVRHIDLPCTAERVWRAIEDARAGTLPPVWREPPAVFATLPVAGAAQATEGEDAI